LLAPLAWQAPSITQLPAVIVWLQLPSPLQLSAVQARPSLHVYVVPPHRLAPLQTSPFVQAFPSSHAVPPDFGLHAVLLVSGAHCSHWLPGLVVALA
jgi:hypothetical protein